MTTATPPWNRRGARAVTEANYDGDSYQGRGTAPPVLRLGDLVFAAVIVGLIACAGEGLAWLVGQFV
jgi:hypothetical protein